MSTLPHTKMDLPNPGKPPMPIKTLTRWDSFLGEIAAGTPLEDAMMKTYITRADIETMCRLDDGGMQKQRWADARLSGLKRSWTIFEFEDIFARVASGMKIDDAVEAVKGTPARNTNFFNLINSDPDLKAQYKAAKEAYSLVIGESLFDLADDDSNDVLLGPKGPMPNMAAVSRSKLQVDTRYRYIASYNGKVFGEKKDSVQVNVQINHAERLEEARSRAKLRDKRVTPKQMAQAIDATFSEKTAVAAVEDTTWMDVPPTDTQWLEEK